MKSYLTACPRNCYSTCSFHVEVEKNRITAIYPDRSNRTVPEGPCIKGLSYIERASSPQRIVQPLLKNKDGTFSPISYSSALDLLAEKLSFFSEKYSPRSILYYTGSGMSGLTNSIGFNFFKLLGGATTTYGNFCWPAGLEAVRLTLGEIKHNAPWDIENARTIILWGKNSAETNIQEINFLSTASERGAKIIAIDPRRTPTVDKADIWISPRPGTDALLALAICRILIDRKLIDTEFIDTWVNGYDEFALSLTTSIDDVAMWTGVSVSDIENLASIIGNGEALTIIPGYGLQRYTNGGQTIRAILAINILTGNLGKPGCSFNYANLQGYVFDHLKEPESYYPTINADPDFRRSISIAKLGADMASLSDPVLKMAWIERGNPITQAPDTNKTLKAFANLEFIVVIDQFMNDTTAIADLLLPAKNMFEQQDIISSYWSPYIFYRPRCLTPPQDVLNEPEIYYNLARKLNLKFSHSEIPDPGEESLDKWLENRIRGMTDLTLDKIKEKPYLAPGYEEIAYKNLKFSTPSGKIDLLAEDAERLWGVPALPAYSKAFRNADINNNFYYLTPNNRNRIHSQFGNLDIIKREDPFPKVQISMADAESLGIADNDYVRIFNTNGSLVLRADVSYRISDGCVSVPNGWWRLEGAGGNSLSNGEETDMGYGTAFHDTRVSIERVKS